MVGTSDTIAQLYANKHRREPGVSQATVVSAGLLALLGLPSLTTV